MISIPMLQVLDVFLDRKQVSFMHRRRVDMHDCRGMGAIFMPSSGRLPNEEISPVECSPSLTAMTAFHKVAWHKKYVTPLWLAMQRNSDLLLS